MEQFRLKPGSIINLSDQNPESMNGFSIGKKEGKKKLDELNRKLEELQELLYAEHKHKVLIILQAMDTGGKDGTIRHVFEGVNPQGVRVANFKVPTPRELDHDYLWRVHRETPAKGEIVIFNRSHYEDVLVVRVHKLVSKEVWSRRYDHINHFERMLVDEGTVILKFFLNIDLKEQKERLKARLDDQTKLWKFNPGDLKERAYWGEYQRAYEDVLAKTSTEWAPWYIIPSNRKWFRNLVIGSILIETLTNLRMKYPKPEFDLEKNQKAVNNL